MHEVSCQQIGDQASLARAASAHTVPRECSLHGQVLAQASAADGQPSQTILAGPVYPTNAAALSRSAVPQATGARLDGGTPYHAFLWPVPDTNSTAAGSISATLYNDSRPVLERCSHA